MTMLKTGWVIVGSTPSNDGTTATKGAGCLIVLDAQGKVAGTIAGAEHQRPLGQHGGDRQRRDRDAVRQQCRLRRRVAGRRSAGGQARRPCCGSSCRSRTGKPPAVTEQTVVGSGFGEQADKDVFLIGPTGLALGADGTLYVSDAIGNRIVAIPDAATRTDQRRHRPRGHQGRPAASAAGDDDGAERPSAGDQRPERPGGGDRPGHAASSSMRAGSMPNKAQSPPGSGDLFGIAMTPAGDGFYYVEDEVNTLVLAR